MAGRVKKKTAGRGADPTARNMMEFRWRVPGSSQSQWSATRISTDFAGRHRQHPIAGTPSRPSSAAEC
jgi:hypothetical protein